MIWVSLNKDGGFTNYHKSFESACIEVMLSETDYGYVVTEQTLNCMEDGEGHDGVKVYSDGRIEDTLVYDLEAIRYLEDIPEDWTDYNPKELWVRHCKECYY